MASVTSTYISPEEYLERERKAEFRSEYFRGEIIAMSGGSRYHGRIITNLVRELGQQLKHRDCNVYSSDLRVAVSSAGMYAYPDVVVTCGEEKFIDETLDTLLNPIVVVEVSSDSTKKYDHGQKFESYRSISSLMEYLMIAQDKVHVEQYARQPDDHWLLTDHRDATSCISLASVGIELRLSDVYEKVGIS